MFRSFVHGGWVADNKQRNNTPKPALEPECLQTAVWTPHGYDRLTRLWRHIENEQTGSTQSRQWLGWSEWMRRASRKWSDGRGAGHTLESCKQNWNESWKETHKGHGFTSRQTNFSRSEFKNRFLARYQMEHCNLLWWSDKHFNYSFIYSFVLRIHGCASSTRCQK